MKQAFDVKVKYYKSKEEVIRAAQSEPLEINDGVMLWRFDSYEKGISLQSAFGKSSISSQMDYYDVEEVEAPKKRKTKK